MIGSGESGKSTIVKQMKIIHQNGYTIDELAMYRLTVYKNLVDCAKALVVALEKFDIEPVVAINKVRAVYLSNPQMPLSDDYALGVCGVHLELSCRPRPKSSGGSDSRYCGGITLEGPLYTSGHGAPE